MSQKKIIPNDPRILKEKWERNIRLSKNLGLTSEKFHRESLPHKNKPEPMNSYCREFISNVLEGKTEITRDEFKTIEEHHRGYPRMYETISQSQEDEYNKLRLSDEDKIIAIIFEDRRINIID